MIAYGIAKWDGSVWAAIPSTGEGIWAYTNTLAWDGANVYAGGSFGNAGGIAVSNIAKWDGSGWCALGGTGGGINGQVNALAWDGTNLYAGGNFTNAGGVAASNVAKWDGSAWSALGTGMSGRVNSLAWDGANLYAGGNFTTAGGVAVHNIAKWDGTVWSALGTGIVFPPPSGYPQSVYALAWDGNNLYAGGNFTTAGGVAANCIAKWDGMVWSSLGSGITPGDGYLEGVVALALDGNNLYAGGNFTTAGGVTANLIAKWDGTVWSALGTGMGGTYHWVNALAWDGANLYAGGLFTTAGGVSANYVAKWDGIAWSALGSGMNNGVTSLASSGTSLYVGGFFTTAGGKASANIARWIPCSVPSAPSGLANNSAADAHACLYSGVTVTWTANPSGWNDEGPGARTYDVLRNDSPVVSGLPYGTTEYTDQTGLHGTTYTYKVRYHNGCGMSAETTGSDAADYSSGTAPDEVASFNDLCNWTGVTGADGYRVYMGTYSDLPKLKNSTADGCLRYEGLAANFDCSGDDPGSDPDRLFWYLVTAYIDTCEGSAGNGTGFTRNLSSSGNCQ